jgi:hypothetical protein
MEVKEAIEFLEGQKNKPEDPVEPNRLGINLTLNGIIELLQRGEKFEKMWEEVETLFTSRSDKQGGEWLGNNILRNMEDIKQKYFPSLIKKTITIEFESKSEDLIDESIKPLKNVIEGWYSGAVKIKIKEVNQ